MGQYSFKVMKAGMPRFVYAVTAATQLLTFKSASYHCLARTLSNSKQR